MSRKIKQCNKVILYKPCVDRIITIIVTRVSNCVFCGERRRLGYRIILQCILLSRPSSPSPQGRENIIRPRSRESIIIVIII